MRKELRRFLLISAFSLSAITLFVEVNLTVFHGNTALASSGERGSDSPSRSTFSWNLTNSSLPLINLPERISEGLDLTLVYSMDQFEFPLSQSLYYNRRAGKYILMVFPKEGRDGGGVNRRAEFIDLDRVRGLEQSATNGKLGWRLTDQGQVKLLTTSEGTVYSFARLTDGELHCQQIKDRNGVIVNLEYNSDWSLQTIADGSGRRVNFSYNGDSLSAIAQSWSVNSKTLRKTWVIAEEAKYAHRPVAFAGPASGVGFTTSKHIPSNAIKPTYTAAMVASDSQLAAIFGGQGAIAAANGFEPTKLGSQYPLYRGDLMGDDGRVRRGHLSFAMHLYGSEDGRGETALYVPSGFTSHSNGPTPTDAVVTFYYPRLGNLTDVTLAVFHVTNFQLVSEQHRVRIGTIGGPGGSVSYYRHSHLEFYHGDTGLPSQAARTRLRIDPATVFASR